MNPEDLVSAMCARHGLPPESGAHLLPLVKKALEAPDAIRNRILTVVDGSLALTAQGRAGGDRVWSDVDREVLIAVARVLHGWAPSDSMLDLGSSLDRLGPDAA